MRPRNETGDDAMRSTEMDRTATPDGISDRDMRPARRHFAGAFAPLLLGAVVVTGLSGVLGGYGSSARTRNAAASLSIEAPKRIRNGEFFETVIRATATSATEDLTIIIPADLYHHVTINTMIPAAQSEAYADGAFRFGFGPHDAGETIEVKIDSQINPARFGHSSGIFEVADGGRTLARLPWRMEVLP